MRVFIAPDKFKGCLSAHAAARAIAKGVRRACPRAGVDLCPLADGGEGTVAALVAAAAGRTTHRQVNGPLPRQRVTALLGLISGGRTAVVEMSSQIFNRSSARSLNALS